MVPPVKRMGTTRSPAAARRPGAATGGTGRRTLSVEQLAVLLLLQLVDGADVGVGGLLDLVERPSSRRLPRCRDPSAASSGDRWRRGGPGGRPLRPSSASLCTSFDSSLRRSSVSGGIGMRITLPSLAGLSPRLDGADRLLDRAHLRRIERLRDDQRRLGHRQRRHLVERHHRAVGLDVHGVEQRHRGAAGAHAARARA